MLRIVHIVPGYPPATSYGGPLVSVSELCEGLSRQGNAVRVLTTNVDGPGQRVNIPTGVEVDRNGVGVRYEHSHLDRPLSLGLVRSIPSYVRWAQVVHLTGVYSFTTLPTLAACRQLDTPLVWSPRGSLQRWRGRTRPLLKDAFELACRSIAPKRTLLHATSTAEAADCRRLREGVAVRIVPNGVHVPSAPEPRAESDALQLLFLGRLHPIKGLDRLLDACSMLADLPWHLHLGGSGDAGYMQELRDQVKRLDMEGHVTFHGDVRDDAKRALFATSDVLVLPSHSENFGLVVVEALAEGLPVIASKGTPWEGLETRKCGFWVSNDPAELAQAIVRMSDAPRATMGKHGREWMLQEFAWSRIAEVMAATYEEAAQLR